MTFESRLPSQNIVISSPSPRVAVDRRSDKFEKVDVREAKGTLLLCILGPLGSWCIKSNVGMVGPDDCDGWRSLLMPNDGSTTVGTGDCVALGVEAESDPAAVASAGAEGVDVDVDVDGRSDAGIATVSFSLGFDLDEFFTW